MAVQQIWTDAFQRFGANCAEVRLRSASYGRSGTYIPSHAAPAAQRVTRSKGRIETAVHYTADGDGYWTGCVSEKLDVQAAICRAICGCVETLSSVLDRGLGEIRQVVRVEVVIDCPSDSFRKDELMRSMQGGPISFAFQNGECDDTLFVLKQGKPEHKAQASAIMEVLT